MCSIDKHILDSLTYIPLPKGFINAEHNDKLSIDGDDYPIFKADSVVIGSGAAGLRAAVELKRRGQNVIIVTAGLYMGTSACSGSDKQTLFTASTSNQGDDFFNLANALSNGGSMDHDIAYVEAVGSIHTLAGLQYLGLELPEDEFGGILRYQTDHDDVGRATSCGPRTSRLMVKVLLDEVLQLNIPILNGATAIKLLRQHHNNVDRCTGIIVSTGSRIHNSYGLAAVIAPNIVLATGGPGELYRDSVYPKKCYGSLGLALEEGITLTNIIESQFGISTPRTAFPWNLSGTYMQVMPYIYSVDKQGNEYNFLADYYRTTQSLASNIFRKGYQWPFHATRILDFGSSLIDMAIAKEQQKERQIYMDFNRNPEPISGDDRFDLTRLDDDVRTYLENNCALASLPIERLRQMNPLAISLYKMHGYDIETSPLPCSINNQHMNGGIEIDIWGRTSLFGCYAIGEVAGTHGVTRPGGSALNSGQVFAVRVAQHITKSERRALSEDVFNIAIDSINSVKNMIKHALNQQSNLGITKIREEIQGRMSDYAGFICSPEQVSIACRAAEELKNRVYNNELSIDHITDISELFMWRHQTLASLAILTMLEKYIYDGGGSRGARIVLDKEGECIPKVRDRLFEEWRFRPEREEDKLYKFCIYYQNDHFVFDKKLLKAMPDVSKIYFEKNWHDFLTGKIFSNC